MQIQSNMPHSDGTPLAVTASPQLDADNAEARGAAYGLIGLGYGYPDSEWASLIQQPVHWAAWPEVLARLDTEASERLVRFRKRAETALAIGQDGEAGGLIGLQNTFVELFGHTVRGACPPYELEFGESEIIQRASELADIAGFYSAFGLQSRQGNGDRPDHLTAECEFMSVLCVKEARAVAAGEEELLDTVRQAQRAFLRDHLGCWVMAFAYRVEQMDPDGVYGALAGFARAVVGGECERMGLPRGPQLIELRSIDETAETEIDCDTVEGCNGKGSVPLVQLNVERPGREGTQPS
ncbi:MAG: molecular chaperone TorD family protein [Planctomycetes bacterium]|nr:molecular chaperone TorD family protein [Planctomycetota bacterium]